MLVQKWQEKFKRRFLKLGSVGLAQTWYFFFWPKKHGSTSTLYSVDLIDTLIVIISIHTCRLIRNILESFIYHICQDAQNSLHFYIQYMKIKFYVEENEIYVSKQPFNMTLYIGMSMNRIMSCNLYSSSQITVFSMLCY